MITWTATSSAVLVITAALLAAFSFRTPSSQSANPDLARSPLDHAERILARRYATGQISAEEYGRMLVVLRR